MPLPLDQVIEGDCLDRVAGFPPASVDLAYLDPPFNTGRAQIAGAGRYDDRWEDPVGYLAFLRPRVKAVHAVLRESGSILVHVDWRTSHYVRLMLDEIFGAEQFVNHLIWSYGLGGSSPRRFARKHDDILFYGRSPEYHFTPPTIPATSQRMRGRMKKSTDVLEIPSINNMATERVGYPTQKPLALLTMLVQACSPAGSVVLDPFCGSGTTLVAATSLGRRYIGIDRNPDAVRLSRRRIESVHCAASLPLFPPATTPSA